MSEDGPINDADWFAYSKELIKNALDSRDKAAAKLQTFIGWLWGIYTGAAALGFTLAGKALPFWTKLLIGSTSIALIAAYWLTVYTQLPKKWEFAANEVKSIKKTYDDNVKSKILRMTFTQVISLIAAALVAISLVVASVSKEEKPEKPQPPILNAIVHTVAGKRFLSLTAMVPPKTKVVTITIKPTQGKDPAKESRTSVYVPTAEGLVQMSTTLESLTPPLEVTLTWEDATIKLRTTMTQTVQESPTAGTKETKDIPAK